MAIHNNIPSMVREALTENLQVAQYCIGFRKNPDLWGSSGCYGYPAAILLFSIADTVGSYVLNGKTTKKRLSILNDSNYYNFKLSNSQLEMVCDYYRNCLTHNSAMPPSVMLEIGQISDEPFVFGKDYISLRLVPFFTKTQEVLAQFIPGSDIVVGQSNMHANMLKKVIKQ